MREDAREDHKLDQEVDRERKARMDKQRKAQQEEERKVRAEERHKTQTMLCMLLPMMSNNNQQLLLPLQTINQTQHTESLENDNVKQPRVETKRTLDVDVPHGQNNSNPPPSGGQH